MKPRNDSEIDDLTTCSNETIAHNSSVSAATFSFETAASLATRFFDFVRDCKKIRADAEIRERELQASVLKTAMKCKTLENIIYKAYQERSEALKTLTDVLKDAIDRKNDLIIVQAMEKIAAIVTSEPLPSLEKIKLWEDSQKTLLPF